MNRVYLGFKDWADVAHEFQAEIGPEPDKVFAAYSTPPYEGDAVVIFNRDGKWWLATGAHCSCYGLEEQWEPEQFDPNVHFAAVAEGKRIVRGVYDEDMPEATDDAVDRWMVQNCN